jgi:hypothetical protein
VDNEEVRNAILSLLSRREFKTVREVKDALVSANHAFTDEQVLAAIRDLEGEDKVLLAPPFDYPNFSSYVSDIRRNPLFAVWAASSAILLIAVLTIPYSSSYSFLRSAISIIYSLLLPGYSSTVALFPRREQLKPLERLAVSLAISLSLVAVSVLFLAYSPFRATFVSLSVLLAAYTTAVAFTASYRKYTSLAQLLEPR